MAQNKVGDSAARDALATYRKLDERINAQMVAALQAAEAGRATAGLETAKDSRTAGLGAGKGISSVLESPVGTRALPGEAASDTPRPPAAFRMGNRT